MNRFVDEQIAIPDVGVRCDRLPLTRFNGRRRGRGNGKRKSLHDLADSPMAMVVCVQHPNRPVRLHGGGDGHKPVLRIIGIGEDAIIREVAVEIM